jgi:MFS transporter, DHA1 family, tetracycline resistance protein
MLANRRILLLAAASLWKPSRHNVPCKGMTGVALTEQQRKKILSTILLTVFIDLLGVTIVIPIVAPLFLNLRDGIMPFATDNILPQNLASALKDALHTRTVTYAFLIASFPLAQFFGAPYLGALADKVGRKKVLTVSLAGTLIGYVIFALGVHYKILWMLFAGRIIDGFTGGNIAIAFSSVADISTPENKTKNFGLIGAAFGVGFIIGPYIGGKLADSSIVNWFSFETPYWVAAALCLVNIIMVVTLFVETSKSTSSKSINIWQGFTNLGKAVSNKHLRTVFLVVLLTTLGFTMFTTFFQVFLIEKFNFTQSNVGDYFAYIGIFIAFTQGFLSRKLTHIIPENIFKVTALALSLALVLVSLPNSLWLLYVVSPLIALSQGLLAPNLQTIVSNSVGQDRQGEISGINQSVQSIGQAVPPIIAAYLVSYGKAFALYGAAGFTLLAWLSFTLFYKKK